MGDIENTLYEYLLVVKQPSKINTENLENGADNEDFNVYLTSEENWKVFLDILDNSFDSVQLKTHFNNLEENERIKVLKFGVACIVSFVQCNFTGPNLPKEVEDMLNKDTHNKINFSKLLAVNNEDINVNTRYPILLVTAKIIFEYCNVDNLINNWWYWRSILVHQEILEELSPSLLSDADRLYKHFQLIPDLNGKH